MPDVFLTKVERKTIITQSFVFVIIMFVISDVMITGPFWFKFFPWLYVLGIVSKSKFSKSIMTLLIVSFTTFISCILKTGGLNIEVLIVTLNSMFMVIIGIITGTFFKELKLGHNLVKFLPTSKKMYMIISTIFFTLLAILINFVINGNIFTYIKSRTSLDDYLSSNYNIKEYEIIDMKYSVINFKSQYLYKIRCDGTEVILKFKNNKSFEDTNYNERKKEELNQFKPLIKKHLEKDLLNNKYIFINNIDYDFEFESKAIKPNKLNVYISYKTDAKDDIYEEIIKTINIINSYKQIAKYTVEYIITYGKDITNITEDNISNLTVQYLKNSFQIDEIH